MGRAKLTLGKAAAGGDLDAVKALLGSGKAEIDACGGSGRTPLLEAIVYDHTAVALYLVRQGADPNAADRGGWTPLGWAAVESSSVPHHNLELAAVLLDAGARVNDLDGDGMTPLMWAANRGTVELVELLIARGADVNVRGTKKNNADRTALMYAKGIAVVRVLLGAGADPTAVEENGKHTWDFQEGEAAELLKGAAGVK